MAYQFYNIGKANARIAELETELAAARAAAPDQQLQARLDDALASNEDISAQLSAATAENTKLQASVTELTAKSDQLGTYLAALTSGLTLACTQMNAGSEEEIAKLSNADKIAALQKSVVKAVAQTGAKTENLPNAAGASTPGSGVKTLTRAEFEKLSFKQRNDFIRTGGKLKD